MGRSGEGFQGTRQTCHAKRCEETTKIQTKTAASFKASTPGQHPGICTQPGTGHSPTLLALPQFGAALGPCRGCWRPIAPSSTPGLRGSRAAPLHPSMQGRRSHVPGCACYSIYTVL